MLIVVGDCDAASPWFQFVEFFDPEGFSFGLEVQIQTRKGLFTVEEGFDAFENLRLYICELFPIVYFGSAFVF